MGVFISHASASAAVAARIERECTAAGLGAWLDDSSLGIGTLLRNELHRAIEKSDAVVLVWSQEAARSRWVSAEVLTAFHLDRFILPCVTDSAPLPSFLDLAVYVDVRSGGDDALRRLVRDAARAPSHANPLPLRAVSPSVELRLAYARLGELQAAVTRPLMKRDLAAAAEAQRRLDPEMTKAERRWPLELDILNLAGYHRKNAYIVKHFDAIQAGRPPSDPVLEEGERFFFEAALVDPFDVSALNGLASILIYERELNAAAFFNDRAIAISKRAGIPYDAAERDKKLIAWMRLQAYN